MRSFVFLVLIASLACGSAPEEVREISPQELLSNPPAQVLILDARTPTEYAAGHVPGAMNVPHDQLADRLTELEGGSGRPVVVYCRSGKRAAIASSVLLEAGFSDVLHLGGHMQGWEAEGLPIEVAAGAAAPD